MSLIYLNDVFLRKAVSGAALNTFLNVLLIFYICKCLIIISLVFGTVGLYVTETGTHLGFLEGRGLNFEIGANV